MRNLSTHIHPLFLLSSFHKDFLWLGFYTQWLILPALFGLAVFIFSFVVQVESESSDIREFCNSTRKMCPICETCESWIMNEACDAYRYSYLVDNHLTIIYAICISLWATTFLEMWKRKAARAAYNWGTHYLRQHEPQRPAFRGRHFVPCEITGLLKVRGNSKWSGDEKNRGELDEDRAGPLT